MVAGKHTAIEPVINRRTQTVSPKVTVLQLDTQFPRIPGDVACPDTYLCDVEIIPISNATVGNIVSNRPDLIDIAPFEAALDSARGDIVVTSCGFLSYWQAHLAGLSQKTLISSSLTAFEHLSQRYLPGEVLTVTFDRECLTELHFGDYFRYAGQVEGLDDQMHLRQVIANDYRELDIERSTQEFSELMTKLWKPVYKHVVLECTNLTPYKQYLTETIGVEVTDILTCIEDRLPGCVHQKYLN